MDEFDPTTDFHATIGDLLLVNQENLHEDRCIGTILGCCVGDILGANHEFKSHEDMVKQYPPNGHVRSFMDSHQRPLGHYTDDTEMMFALYKSIVEKQCVDAKSICDWYVYMFRMPPRRGYGPSVSNILTLLAEKKLTHFNSGRYMYPDGSYANGALMRIAPIGLVFRQGKTDDDLLYRATYAASMCTHVHLEAVDAAFVQAKAVAHLCQMNPDELNDQDVENFVQMLIDSCKTEELRRHLETARQAVHESWSVQTLIDKVVAECMFGDGFQIKAIDALACVLYAFIKHWRDPEMCLVEIVSLGGDSDTTAAILGALLGALHGTSWIPKRWYIHIEKGENTCGRGALISVAKHLAELSFDSDDFIVNDREEDVTTTTTTITTTATAIPSP